MQMSLPQFHGFLEAAARIRREEIADLASAARLGGADGKDFKKHIDDLLK